MKAKRLRLYFALVVALAYPSILRADESSMALASGTCILTAVGVASQCNALVCMHIAKNGRTSFGGASKLGGISFSGNSDIQPALSLYVLKVDSVLKTVGSDVQIIAAKGLCRAKISDDGRHIRLVECESKTPRPD